MLTAFNQKEIQIAFDKQSTAGSSALDRRSSKSGLNPKEQLKTPGRTKHTTLQPER
jgi:hypothetical protein